VRSNQRYSSRKRSRFPRKLAICTAVTALVAVGSDLPQTVTKAIAPPLKVSGSSFTEEQLRELTEQSTSEARGEKRGKHSCAIKRYTVQRGDSFGKIWTKFGGSLEEARSVLGKLKDIGGSADVLKIGETLSLFVSNHSGEIKGVRRTLGDGRVVLLKDRAEGELLPTVIAPVINETERLVSGTIESSLAAAAHRNDIPFEIVDELVDLFGNRIDFRKDMRVGDTFSIIYKESRNDKGALIKSGDIIAASLEVRGKLVAVIRHQAHGSVARYYNENGDMLGESFLRYPLQFTRISSVFTTKRLHPILGKHRPHNGVDFSAPTGTPVRTIADGTISEMGYDSGRGNYVKIKHGTRYATEYFHLSKFATGLRSGQKVSRGMVLGGVGATGLATAPHLHFGFFDNGVYVDPLKADLPTLSNESESIPKDFLLAKLDVLREQHEQSRLAYNQRNPVAG
jgi:murein DD-endopeptidase MepM/ murein hydrolase activator NlpD